MVKERLPKYCYLNFSNDYDEETFRFIRTNQLQNNVRDAVDDVHGGAVDTDNAFSDICSDDYLDDNDVNSDDDGRDDHVLDNNDGPIQKMKLIAIFKGKLMLSIPNGCTLVKN